MMRYRLPIILAICISYLGLIPREISPNKLTLTGFETLTVQTLEANAQEPPQEGSAYDTYMKAGYEATNKKDYKTAFKEFQKALVERPQDPYAQKAIDNIKIYLGTGNPLSKTPQPNNPKKSNLIWLIIGIVFLSLATLGALVSLISTFGKSAKEKNFKFKGDGYKTIAPDSPEKEPIPSTPVSEKPPDNFSESNSENDAQREFSLPVQSTTRIPSLDLIEELLKSLRDPEGKNRRKAIWKLAQVSDSRAMKPLVDLMIETDSYERSLILEALSQVCSRTLKPMNQALAISLQDKNSQVRKNAIRDLTRLYDLMSQISELLCYALEDDDIEVKETAKWALDKLNLRMPIKLNLGGTSDTDESSFEDDDLDDDKEDDDEDFRRERFRR